MARKRRSSFLTAFVDFHNMKLLPKNKPKKYCAGAMPRRRLLAYFEDYAKQVLQCQSAEEYKNFLDASDAPEHFTERLRGTLGGYEHEHGVSWFDSDDYHEFACEYEVLQDMIVRMIGEGKISKYHYNFLVLWARDFSSTTQSMSMKDYDENGDYIIGGDHWEQSARPDKHGLWHGLFFSDGCGLAEQLASDSEVAALIVDFDASIANGCPIVFYGFISLDPHFDAIAAW